VTAKVKKTMRNELRDFRKDFTKYMKDKAMSKYDKDLLEFLLAPTLNKSKEE